MCGPQERQPYGRLKRRANSESKSSESCFFFQAEDGIRDLTVTGVQTCALPISDDRRSSEGPWWPVCHNPSSVIRHPSSVAATACPSTTSHPQSCGRSVSIRRMEWGDRKSGVEGKRVDLGGRRIIKNKKMTGDIG